MLEQQSIFYRNLQRARCHLHKAAYHIFMPTIGAVSVLSALVIEPQLAENLKAFSPFAINAPIVLTTAINDNSKAAPVDSPPQFVATSSTASQQWVTDWLAKRYRVANDAAHRLVLISYLTATEVKLDPLLILAVMAIESGFNPIAESPMGAQGLMQIMSHVHHDKFEDLGGVKAALDPSANIRVGAMILKDYVERGGSVEAGLRMYVGGGATSDEGYGSKVLAEYRRLKAVAIGKKIPVSANS